jgi:nucleotide-binding universal stress UspA family protein
MKVLFGLDGSGSSFDAVRLVGRLLDPANDRVVIYFSPLELKVKLPGRAEAITKGVATALFEEACELLPRNFQNIEVVTSTKSAAEGILHAAEGCEADLAVVGARGAGSLQRLLLGSVSRAVVHGAHLPVLVVRNGPLDESPPRVLACHRPASAEPIAELLGKFRWPEGTQGRVIGVTESMLAGPLPEWLEQRVKDPDTAEIARAWEQEHDEELAALGGQLEAFEQMLPAAFHGREPIVAEGNPAERILEVAGRERSDMIVVGRTPSDRFSRWLLGSTSEAVLSHATTSVLVVPVERKA